ncbi:MAG TPA: hypothetical protein PJ982_09640, partial [Lacipirellulaceae bacterium]|nr:hypothetical protein [Lacipirellulaceae bacterium]
VNWLAGTAALSLVALTRHSPARASAVLAAMGIRLSLVMAAVVLATKWNHPLVAGGLLGYLVVLYLAALVVETVMSLRMIAPHCVSSPAPPGS